MGRNAKGTRGWSVPREERIRRGLELTLRPEIREKLERLARAEGLSKSALIERIVERLPEPHVGQSSRNRTPKA